MAAPRPKATRAARPPAPSRGSIVRRRIIAGLVAIGIGVGAAVAIGQINVSDAIREVTLPLRHDDIIRQQADEKGVDPALIAAVIEAESGFDSAARSDKGARGLMQVTPATALDIAERSQGTTFRVRDLGDPDINIRYGTFHLEEMMRIFGGNEVAALAAYNAGSGTVEGWGGADLELGDIEFPETRAYVEQVLEKREEYRDNYPEELGL
ncbi:lytic transglycosylase domain-containing protein [Thermoleophilia bacterium SCSIO 60948]|nr:lytic transglycosylase domain-containing protein [Thermoleophilia bacterium SCSIO 60948]